MLAHTPTTVLEAVNAMLHTIGEAPVSTVENSGVLDAVSARQQLSFINREVQTRGWHWNTEPNVTITPTHPEGYIVLPSNTLRVDTSGFSQDIDAVMRGNRLYDRQNHTYEFKRPVTVDLVVLLPFEELPEAARLYITIRAARKFQEGILGSPDLSQFTLRDEIMAKATLEDAEADTADYNILDNVSVREVLLR